MGEEKQKRRVNAVPEGRDPTRDKRNRSVYLSTSLIRNNQNTAHSGRKEITKHPSKDVVNSDLSLNFDGLVERKGAKKGFRIYEACVMKDQGTFAIRT